MINKIEIVQYRKLKDIDIKFDNNMNIISGTNGTCKSSLLYLVSNAFQEVKTTAPWLKNKEVLRNIKSVNNGINLKIESLTRGDEKYNNPAKDVKGCLYKCVYEDGMELEFRRHNTSGLQNRFALKPLYKKGAGEKLPQLPVIYLGLSRLYSFGEYNLEASKVKKQLPEKYFEIVRELYKKFTGLDIQNEEVQEMTDIKKRARFSTNKEGVDSNTISSGEDNLLIILLAVVSLRYYYENIDSIRNTESILLIDEVDATLHPAYQSKLWDLFYDYAEQYKIKFICTSHSLSLLEYAFNKKSNVIYLLDNITNVIKMEDADIYKIKMYLNNQLKEDIYINRSIPVFTEDDEARLFLNCLFDYYERNHGDKFRTVRNLFHLVQANISGDTLSNIFKDDKLLRSTMRSICILDGDKNAQKNLNNYTITLPGKLSPEELAFKYAETLLDIDSDFWTNEIIIGLGYTKIRYTSVIKLEVESINEKIKQRMDKKESTKGMKRELNKQVFNNNKRFFEFVMRKWIEDNKLEVEDFYNDLKILFCKVSEFHDISSSEWK